MLTTSISIEGFRLHGTDGELGKVRDFLFDDRHWVVRYLVADTGTWLSDRQVLVSPYSLGEVDSKGHRLNVGLTKAQIEGAPPLSTDLPVSRQYESQYHSYYGWPDYWMGPYVWGSQVIPRTEAPEEKHKNSTGKEWDPHLRSTNAVGEYNIGSIDGDIGRVSDFILDTRTWAIRYLVVDTGSWWPGKQVLVAPAWIGEVSWDHSKVFVNLTKEAIKNSPEYTRMDLITRDYEVKLHGHFNKEGYWVDEVPGPQS